MATEISPSIKDVTEAIQSLPSLFGALAEVIQTPAGIATVILVLCWLLFNHDASKTLDLLERKQKRKIELLNEFVSNPDLTDSDSVKVLRDLRTAHYFQVATEIYAEHRLRKALIDLHSKTSHKISWKHIKAALPYIDTQPSNQVKLRKVPIIDLIGYVYNFLVGCCFFVGAAFMLALPMFYTQKTLSSFAIGVISMLILGGFGIYAFLQNFPINARKLIERELAQTENNSISNTPPGEQGAQANVTTEPDFNSNSINTASA